MRTSALLSTVALSAGLLSCDAAKKFIDPSGNAYGTPPDTAKADSAKAPEASAPAPAPAPAAPPAPSRRDVPPLEPSGAIAKASDMLLTTPSGWVEFHQGRASAQGRRWSLWNEREAPWGLAISDLDQDGADDAVFVVRSVGARDTAWRLAVLLDREGALQCIQSIALPLRGLRGLEASPGGVVVQPDSGTPLLYGWLGGELRAGD